MALTGGYLAAPVVLNDPVDPRSPRLLIAPGERAEIVVDFSAYAPGAELLLRNNAKAPFPNGVNPNPQTVGQIMQFRVVPLTAPDESVVPATLGTVTPIGEPSRTRVMTLNEHMEDDVPVGAFLNGMPFHDTPGTEFPELGATEQWEIVNMTGDAHPIHLHLVQFQLLDRQKINVRRYEEAFEIANPEMPADTYVEVPIERYLRGRPSPPDPNERGWKDTFRMNPGEVTRVRIRFAPQDESPQFAFDATAEPGYVWHCHILEHEENDMMRPFHLVAPGGAPVVARAPAVAAPLEPGTFGLAPLVPNPATAVGTFRFTLREAGTATLEIYDVAGRMVRGLVNEARDPGEHVVRWDGRADDGRPLAAGAYFVTLRANGVAQTRKLVVTP